jgi:pimeloyl-ACP methyl ester carboxylesterase
MPYDADPMVSERFVRSPDGLQLFVRDYAPAAPESGAPVICLHGLTRNSRDFELVAPRIAALGRRVLAFDMRGRGRSDYDPNPDHYAPAIYAKDIAAAMETLNMPRAAFIGTSMGGIITMLLAATAPERIGAAVLNDIGPVLEDAGLKRIAAYVGKAPSFASWDEAARGVMETQGPAFPNRDAAFWMRFVRRICAERPDGRITFDYDPLIARPFASTSAPDMTPLFEALVKAAPVLVVRGRLSDLLSAEGLELMRIVKPDLKAVEVPDVGHAPTLEEEPAWAAIIDFLANAP